MLAQEQEEKYKEPAVDLADVDFTYDTGTAALRHLTCRIYHGEITAIVGPSGSGKSTLLRIISGLLPPTGGSVQVTKRAAASGPDVAMVFQEDVVLPWLSVRSNVGLHSRFSRNRSDPADLDALIGMMGLLDFAEASPRELSGGMRRRVGVLQPLASDPSVLLMDEPFTSVDEPTRIAIHQDLRKLLKKVGMTAVLVTHDLAEAVSISDRVLIVSKRPAAITQDIPIPLGVERDMLELRQETRYLELYGHAWEMLRAEIEKR